MMYHARQEQICRGAVETLQDAADHFRTVSEQIGAKTFHLYGPDGSDEGPCLAPYMDASYPVLLPATQSLLQCLPPRFADTVASVACPLWWGDELAEGFSDSWSEQILCTYSSPGLALPLRAEKGRFAVVLFLGDELRFDSDTLMDVHAVCHGLFRSITQLLSCAAEAPVPTISPRELQCLKLTAKGLTSQEIAQELGLSVHTTNQYLANTTQKLNAMNRVHAVAKALRSGLID